MVFSLAFPLVFILVFGFIGGRSGSVKVGIDKASDTASAMYQRLASAPNIRLVTTESQAEMEDDLRKGRLTAILRIENDAQPGTPVPHLKFHVKTSTATSPDNKAQLINVLQMGINAANDVVYPRPSIAEIVRKRCPAANIVPSTSSCPDNWASPC